MKKIWIALALFCAFFKVFADDDERLKLAVMDFEDLSGKLSDETLTGASEYFRVIFAQTNRYIIISKDRQKNEISDMRKKFNTNPSYKSCTDKNCQIQLGQALSADLILKTSVSFFAGSYTLASELIDLEKEATIITATEEYDGSPTALKTAIKNIVAKIVKTETEINGEISAQEKKPQKSSSSKDSIACEYARSESNDFAWKSYLSKYPNGECAAEAKDELDKSACKTAEKKNSVAAWKEYLKEFPDGKCEFKANTILQKHEAKEKEKLEAQKKLEAEKPDFNSKADEKLNKTFSGRWNLGLGLAFSRPNIVGFSTGLDFDFKVFEKPYGGGAGILFVGLGFDLRYWITTGRGVHHGESYKEYDDTTRNNLINFPIQFNFGYEFKLGNQTLRYFGLWFSPGLSLDMDIYDNGIGPNEFYFTASFSWKITMNMIFKNGMLFNLGFGGNKSKEHPIRQGYDYWHLDHIFLMIGTGVIF